MASPAIIAGGPLRFFLRFARATNGDGTNDSCWVNATAGNRANAVSHGDEIAFGNIRFEINAREVRAVACDGFDLGVTKPFGLLGRSSILKLCSGPSEVTSPADDRLETTSIAPSLASI